MTSAALLIAIGSTGVSCGTGPEEFSPVTGVWVALADSRVPVKRLELAMLADSAGEIFGTCTVSYFQDDLRLTYVVRGDYIHPDVAFSISLNQFKYGEYTGQRGDNNTIDGNLTWLDSIGATRLKRKRSVDEAG